MDNSFETGWNHLVKDDKGFYVGGRLIDAMINLDGFYIVDMKIHDTNSIWLNLKEQESRR